ncbi:MAG: ferritin family protein [Chloroflexi bacterium]|nr:ferritin family protein [Chloroflexota bacterium]
MPANTAAIDALKVALKIEDEGRRFYRQAARKSENSLTKRLFTNLAGQELVHKKVFQEVHDKMCAGETCPVLSLPQGEAAKGRTIFASAMKDLGAAVKSSTSEQDAIDLALEKEIKSRDFYAGQAQRADDPVEKSFYNTMAGEEQGHYLQLTDYREYLINPAGYFVMKERHSLDGA